MTSPISLLPMARARSTVMGPDEAAAAVVLDDEPEPELELWGWVVRGVEAESFPPPKASPVTNPMNAPAANAMMRKRITRCPRMMREFTRWVQQRTPRSASEALARRVRLGLC